MARIKQVGVGRKTTGTIDGVNYYVRNGETFARAAPNMPASAYNTPEARLRQAIFKMIQQHTKYHLRTIKQTISSKGNVSSSNRYISLNYKAFAAALADLAEQYCAGEPVTLDDIEAAISAYAAAHPKAITIASKSGYSDVWLAGAWPETITLNALAGDSTVIIIVNEYGQQTTINADGTTTTGQITVNGGSGSNTGGSSTGSEAGGDNSGGNSGSGDNTGGNSGGNTGSVDPVTVAAPTFSGADQFTETTQVTMTAESGATIHYTTDGTTPTSSSTTYSVPITLSDTTTVKAIAIKDGISSSVTSRTYTKTSGGGSGDMN